MIMDDASGLLRNLGLELKGNISTFRGIKLIYRILSPLQTRLISLPEKKTTGKEKTNTKSKELHSSLTFHSIDFERVVFPLEQIFTRILWYVHQLQFVIVYYIVLGLKENPSLMPLTIYELRQLKHLHFQEVKKKKKKTPNLDQVISWLRSTDTIF
jgi:hypothetical protein